jgi:amino acid permease
VINVIGIVETLYKFLLRWMGVLYFFFFYMYLIAYLYMLAHTLASLWNSWSLPIVNSNWYKIHFVLSRYI